MAAWPSLPRYPKGLKIPGKSVEEGTQCRLLLNQLHGLTHQRSLQQHPYIKQRRY